MEHIYESYKFCMNKVLIEAIKELERNIFQSWAIPFYILLRYEYCKFIQL